VLLFVLAGALLLPAQVDLSGYWAFHVKDGGVNYFQLQQNGEELASIPSAAGQVEAVG
jgi:hypothetical protein